MFKNILKKLRSDRGDGSLVSLILVIPLLVGLLFTIVDLSAYFANRAYVQTVAHNGARTVAIMGGNGSAAYSTQLEYKYGQTKETTCDKVSRDKRAAEAKTIASTAIECNMMADLQDATGLINVSVQSVKCTPSMTSSIGQRVSCEIKWSYGGTPGSGMSMFPADLKTGKHFGEANVTAGSSESEVDLTGTLLVPRR